MANKWLRMQSVAVGRAVGFGKYQLRVKPQASARDARPKP